MENENQVESPSQVKGGDLSLYVTDIFQEFKNGRKEFETKAEEWWNNFLSQYQSSKVWKNKEGEGNRSRIFIKLTQQKCYTAHAKVMDALGTDVPFDFEAVPDLDYSGIPPEAIEEAAKFRKNYIAEYLKYIKYFDTLDDATLDATIFPISVIKGPIIIKERKPVVKRRMIMGIPAEQLDPRIPPFIVTLEEVERYDFETVPFWDYYVDVNAKSPKQSIGEIHYKRLLPQEFRELFNAPGYDKEQMKMALAEIDNLKSSVPDGDNDFTDKKLADKFNGFEAIKDNRIPILEFSGLANAGKLREFGADIPEGIFDEEDVEAHITVVLAGANFTIRAQYNIFGYRPFMGFGVKKIPNCVYKNSIAGLMDDSQSMVNSGARLFIDGKALSGNGCVALHTDKIDWQRTKDASIYPRKTFYLTGANTTVRDAIDSVTFPDVTLGIKDMVQMFMQIADEETGIPKYSQGGSDASYLNKMLDINTPVPMADGSWKLLADIVDGDKIIGKNGLSTTVVKAHEIHYPERAYNIKFNSGEVIRAGGEHLWTVINKKGVERVVNTDEMFSAINSRKEKLSIPKVERPLFGSNKRLPLDPYILGLWLGDGHSYGARITTQDEEIVESLRSWCALNGGEVVVDKTQNSGKAITYYVRGSKKDRRSGKNGRYEAFSESLHGKLRMMGLCKKNVEIEEGVGKHIPEEYLQASYEDRLALLRGLMDTDGCHHSGSLNIFIQKEGRLVEDVIRLIEGLGGFPRVHKTNPGAWAKPGVSYYQIHFSTVDNPFKMTKKASKWRPMQRKSKSQTIKSIEMTDICKMRCLTVDAPDGLFCVGEKFTVTHNTATGMSMLMGAANVNLKPFLKNIDDGAIEPTVERLDSLFSMLGKYPPQYNIPLKVVATGTISMMARELIVENMLKLLQITANPQDSVMVNRRSIIKAMAEKLGLSKFVKTDAEIQQIEMMMAQRQQPIQAEGKVDVDKLFPMLTPVEQAQVLQSVGLQADPRRLAGMSAQQTGQPMPAGPGIHQMPDGTVMTNDQMAMQQDISNGQ